MDYALCNSMEFRGWRHSYIMLNFVLSHDDGDDDGAMIAMMMIINVFCTYGVIITWKYL